VLFPDEGLGQDLAGLLRPWPPDERIELMRELARSISSPEMILEAGRLALTRRENSRALDILKPLAEAKPRDIEIRLALAAAAAPVQRQTALTSLLRARELHPDANQSLAIADLYVTLGENKRALAFLKPLAEINRENFEFWLTLAAAAAPLERRTALAALRSAERPDLSDDRRLRLAIAYQDLREFPQAELNLDRLVLSQPRNGEFLADRGVLKVLRGQTRGAVADLEAAVRLRPDFLPAAISLGTLYVSEGKTAEALKLYDAALANPASAADSPDRDLIAKERLKLLAAAR
jgi:predicted Zn-dependent protease